jgi:hypothetical protein
VRFGRLVLSHPALALVDLDNVLRVDLECVLSLESFAAAVKARDEAILLEPLAAGSGELVEGRSPRRAGVPPGWGVVDHRSFWNDSPRIGRDLPRWGDVSRNPRLDSWPHEPDHVIR